MIRIMVQKTEEIKLDLCLGLGPFSESKMSRVRLFEADGKLMLQIGDEDDLSNTTFDFSDVELKGFESE